MNALHKNAKYGSHLPVLTRVMDATTGPVLEIGMGLWSTPILDNMCEQSGRRLVSYDNDEKWFEENRKWSSQYHTVLFAEDWDSIPIDNDHWSVVFVDHRPARRRREEIKRLKDNADFIVIHDTEPEQDRFFGYESIWKHFKYRYHYTKSLPNTSVVSNFINVKEVLC